MMKTRCVPFVEEVVSAELETRVVSSRGGTSGTGMAGYDERVARAMPATPRHAAATAPSPGFDNTQAGRSNTAPEP